MDSKIISMKEAIQISIPEEILKKAEKRGVNIESFKSTVNTFALLDLMARTSKLSKNQANEISEKMKASAWKKIKKDLKV